MKYDKKLNLKQSTNLGSDQRIVSWVLERRQWVELKLKNAVKICPPLTVSITRSVTLLDSDGDSSDYSDVLLRSHN